MQEKFPEFFKEVESIIMYDPLSEVLGSIEDGVICFSYGQIVKAAGHSCPTVAGAYLTCKRALEVLYPEKLPVRGEIQVAFAKSQQSGVTGVISNVMSHITGACAEGGFKGLNGSFSRHSLLSFSVNMSLHVKLTRVDTNKSVELLYNPDVIPPSVRLQELMKKVLSQNADQKEKKEFGLLWQDRVKKILIDNRYNKEMIIIKEGI
jgi:hypothetical protein